MSFLTEIIHAANKAEVSTVIEKTPELVSLVEETKKEFSNFLDNVFVKFSQPARKDTNLCEKVNSTMITLTELEESANEMIKQDIGNAQKEMISYGKTLSETKEELMILECLISIHNNFNDANHLFDKEKYGEATELIKVIKTDIEALQCNESLTVLQDIHEQINELVGRLLAEMDDKVHQCISFNSDENIFNFKIKDDNTLQDLFSAYSRWDDRIPILDNITKKLWDHVFYPIVNFNVSIVVLLEDIHMLETKILNKTTRSTYKEVFENIIIVIDFFEKHFKYLLQDCTTLEYIGNDLKDNLSELLIKNCLNDTIPTNSEQLQNYDVIIKEVDFLQAKLISSGFFSKDMNSLLEHANNVDEYYIRKKCEMYLKMVDTIVKKDLHNMVEVGTPMDVNNPFKIDPDVFYQRSVSKSCLELMELTEDVIKQISKISEPSSKILYCATQAIFAEYGDRVIEHHQKLLQTIPQQVALFFNNCSYLSHILTQWDGMYGPKVKSILNIEESLFSREIRALNLVGTRTFEDFIEQQINQMEQIMKESGLINISTLEELNPVTEKCVRQCLRQQELLRTVWHKVLSYSDYNKNLGNTLNSMCKCIIDAVLNITDITSKAGGQLVDVLKIISTRGPKLFTDQKDVFVYVEQWHKLNELAFLLNANLLEIADRWADGKGPLALQFKADELKQLIKALFQNTDRRAAILARIKEEH